MSDDATRDTGDGGARAEDKVGGWIGEKNDGEAVYWYGVYSLIMGIGALYVWIFFNDIAAVVRYSWGFQAHYYFYIPVGMSWLLMSFIDNDQSRAIFKYLVAISVLGPFYTHWTAFAGYLWTWNDSQGLFWYLWGAGWFVGTIIQEIVQIILLPQIFNWIDGGNYDDEDNGDRELDVIHRLGSSIGI